MRWNGIVSNSARVTIARTFSAANAIHASSTQRLRSEPISDTSYRLDDLGAELGSHPPDAYVHDVAPGVEPVPPHLLEQPLARADVAPPPHQVAEHQELALRQDDLTLP